MNLKKALLLGALAYIVSYIITNGIAFLLGTEGMLYAISAVVITIVILVLFTLQYFKKVRPGVREGFLFGLVAGIVGIVIDTIIRLATLASLDNLINPAFYGAVVMVIAVSVIIGFVKGRTKT